MTTLMLKDLKASQELDTDSLAVIRGGSNAAVVGGQAFTDYSVIDLFSPNIVVKADTVLQIDDDFLTNVLSPGAFNLTA